MRLRISFDDIKTLFNYLDWNGKGCLKYENFTLLLEERWRGIDPIEASRIQNMEIKQNPMEPQDKSSVDIYSNCRTDHDKLVRREWLCNSSSKTRHGEVKKIGRDDDREFDFGTLTAQLPTRDNHMADLMKNDYHRKSMELRIQRKALLQQFQQGKKVAKLSHLRPTNASILRSQTILDGASEKKSVASSQ